MSRLGKMPVEVPTTVKTFVKDGVFKVEGPKGKLEFKMPAGVDVNLGETQITTTRASDSQEHRAMHGLVRAIVSNMVKGASEGYQRRLEIFGVGYKAALKGKILNLNLGLSHEVNFPIPEGIEIKCESATKVLVEGPNKELVGQVCATIRGFRPPEPYQGKGVRYEGENIRRKAGKAAAGGK